MKLFFVRAGRQMRLPRQGRPDDRQEGRQDDAAEAPVNRETACQRQVLRQGRGQRPHGQSSVLLRNQHPDRLATTDLTPVNRML